MDCLDRHWINKKLDGLQADIRKLEGENHELKQEVATLTERLVALERRLEHLSNNR